MRSVEGKVIILFNVVLDYKTDESRQRHTSYSQQLAERDGRYWKMPDEVQPWYELYY